MADLVEPGYMPAIFVDDLAEIEVDRHGLARLTFAVEQREGQTGEIERLVAVRLIVPGAQLQDIAARLLSAQRRSASADAEPVRQAH